MKFSAYLLEDNGYSFQDLVKSDSAGRWFELTEKYGFDVAVYLGKCKIKNPLWLDFIKDAIDDDVEDELEDYHNSSTRAVIIVKLEGYFVAYPLGFGRHLLWDYPIVRDFGIKVALNNVNPSKLKGMDKLTISDNMMQSKQQSSKSTNVNEFDVDKQKDFLRTIAGETLSNVLDKRISGSDSVQFSHELDFDGLHNLSIKLLEYYNSDHYKVNFAWFDNVQVERNKSTVERLNQLLIDEFNGNREIFLVPPEIVEDLYVDEMSFTEKGEKYTFDINSLLNYFEIKDIDFTYENIKKKSLYIHNGDGELQHKWRLLNCLMTEVEFEDNVYSYMMGSWFKVNADYLEVVNNYLDGVDVCSLDLADCNAGEHEGPYNERAVDIHGELLLMDKKMVRGVEVCDLLSREKHLIHIKHWTSSSTMSHLFSQGRVSATMIHNDVTFRNEVKSKLQEIDISFDVIDMEAYRSSDYEVVYGVIYPGDKSISERLPFFSKVNMKQSVETLRGLGFKVSQMHIRQNT